MRKLQLSSEFEVRKTREKVYVAFTEKAGVGLLSVKCRQQINNWASFARLAPYMICIGIRRVY